MTACVADVPKRLEKPAAWKLHTSTTAWRISSVDAMRRWAIMKAPS